MEFFTKKKIGLKYSVINYKNHFIMLTNEHEENTKIICVSKKNPNRKNWFDLIKNDNKINIKEIVCQKKFIALLIQKDGFETIGIINLREKIKKNKPKEIKYLNFSGLIYNLDLETHNDTNKVLISYTSYIVPKIYYEYNFEKDNIKIIYERKVNNFNSELYETELIYVSSHDNVKIPLSIVYKKEFGDLKNQPRSFLLSAYGSYGLVQACVFGE